MIELAFGQAQRLRALTEGLLSLSRIEGGADGSHVETSDLSLVARDAVDSIASRAEQLGRMLELELPDSSVMVCAGQSGNEQSSRTWSTML